MRVAILDVGANALRLLIAEPAGATVRRVREERTQLNLGEEIETTGRISVERLEAAATAARSHVRTARKLRCEWIEVLVTSPGRQAANGDELVRALAEGARAPVRVLSAEEEARLGYAGAIGAASGLPEVVAVCDVGGGSTQIVVGTRSSGPIWFRSIDLGSLRLASRTIVADPPGQIGMAAARREARECMAGLQPPPADAALATGGSARGLRRLVGGRVGAAELQRALAILAERAAGGLAADYGLGAARAHTLPAGVVILAEVQKLLRQELRVADGGLREGAALALLEQAAAAA